MNLNNHCTMEEVGLSIFEKPIVKNSPLEHADYYFSFYIIIVVNVFLLNDISFI